MDRLEALVGLSNVKQVMKELSAFMKEMSHNEKLTNVCRHMIFEGNPGTGKTVCAKITADIMAEMGQSNSVFVDASRKDIVAGYVGQTAPKIANLFKRARGGVLFVDEAGFFLQDAKGSYNQEAIKEFVRYMELYQDVIVIFALYPHEVEDWLDLEAGLSSRISRIVKFEDYSDKEMIEIAHYMCEQRGYCTEQAADSVISDYIAKRKSLDKKKFGNAREVRKLVEAAIFARSIRRYDDNTEDTTLILSKDDFKNGAARLMQESKEFKIKNAFGFSMGATAYEDA
jgi:SpoVK/Ycf46/Vps4 family AAA+-type ATPase